MNPGEMLSGKFTLPSVLSIGESTLYRRDQVSLNLTGEPAKEKSRGGYGRLQGGALGSVPPEEDFLRPRRVSLSPRELGSPSLRGFGSTSSAQAVSEEMGALLFFPPSGWPSSFSFQESPSFTQKLLGLLMELRKAFPHSPFWLEYEGREGLWVIHVRLSEPNLDPDEQEERLFSTVVEYKRLVRKEDPNFPRRVVVNDV